MEREKDQPQKETSSKSSNTPDLTQYIEGYRIWYKSAVDDRILSYNHQYKWPRHRRAEAVCHISIISNLLNFRHILDHTPHEFCSCGIYAMHEKNSDLFHYAKFDKNAVVGRVAGWGKVIVGKKGWRAQYAYPLSLSDASLAKQYGVKYERRKRTRIEIAGIWMQGIVLTWQLINPFVFSWNHWSTILIWWVATTIVGTLYVKQWE